VAVTEEPLQFLDAAVDVLQVGEAQAHGVDVALLVQELFHHRSVGHDDAVIEAAAPRRGPALGEHANDLDGQVAHLDELAHGTLIAEELPGRFLTDDPHVGVAPDVILGEVGALHDGPRPGHAVIARGPHDLTLVPVSPVGNRGGSHPGRGGDDVGRGEGLADGLHVLEGNRFFPLADSAGFFASAHEHDGVGAEAGHDVKGLLVGALRGGDDDRDGRNPQGNAHEAEKGPQLEGLDGLEGLDEQQEEAFHRKSGPRAKGERLKGSKENELSCRTP